ncbi:MAG TPA: NAD-binding protein, partial [Armatimonadota bacterium]
RYGTGIAEHLSSLNRRVYGVDFDPEAVKMWQQRGGHASFGDAEDPEFPSMLPLACARWVISSFPDRHTNIALIRSLQSHGFTGSIAVTAGSPEDAEKYRLSGADIVFSPLSDAASQAVDIIIAVDEQERRKKMDELIAKLHDHYVVCGYGRMGQQIGKDFRQRGVPFVVIESNPSQIPKLKEQNIAFVEGNASEDRILQAAGIKRAKGLIAVNPTDEENVFIVLTARGLNADLFIVARSILQENEDKLRRAGANKVISPYILGGHRMAEAVLSPRAMEFLDLISRYDRNESVIGDIEVSKESTFAGLSIRDSKIRDTTGVLILAIGRTSGEKKTNPSPQTVIEAGDELIVMGTSEQVDAAEKLAAGE